MTPPIQSVIVLGAGSAGLIAALALKRKFLQLGVLVVRSPNIGVIGVGEGTTPGFPSLLFHTLGIKHADFYPLAEPVWKLGVRFLWGPREEFHYTFSKQIDAQYADLPRPHGFYCDEEFRCVDLPAALMAHDKVFLRNPNGDGPDIGPWHGFHIENRKLVEALEVLTREAAIEIIDATVTAAERGPQGIAALVLEDGRRLVADFLVDASGFRSELLGRALEEPFISYDRALFCDRAIVGGWPRTSEPILPYTTAETMEAGWSWQIEHEHFVNRGYVFSSQAISDDAAHAEFRAKNPKLPDSMRVVKFRSGRYARPWIGNVLAVGNSYGFVEPLEASALMILAGQCETLIKVLQQGCLQPTESLRALYNETLNGSWDDVRDFLALHYKLNTRLDNPFWRHCIEETDLGNLPPFLEFYEENGPLGLSRYLLPSTLNAFGIEGYLAMMVGNRAPYRARYTPSIAERQLWDARRANLAAQARGAMDVREALGWLRHPGWRWNE